MMIMGCGVVVMALMADAPNEALDAALRLQLKAAEQAVAKAPSSATAWLRLGNAKFFLGDFAGAVADYDRVVEHDPASKASLWQRGIALYYARRYQDGAAQFDAYHSFDQVDRENGLWRYLCIAAAESPEAASKRMLAYDKNDRPPMPDVYALFAGEITAEQLVEKVEKAKAVGAEREKLRFYAHLYLGLHAAARKDEAAARQWLAEAAKNPWPASVGGGPGFMGHVARLHLKELQKPAAAEPKASP